MSGATVSHTSHLHDNVTPSRSPVDATPACGESIYKSDLGEENIKKVDSILESERTIDGKNGKLQNDKTTFTGESPKNEPPPCHILTKIRLLFAESQHIFKWSLDKLSLHCRLA
jgi:hypothetical protein